MNFVNIFTLDINTTDVTMGDIWFSGSIMVVALTTLFILATELIRKGARK
nr:MAG TPA: hypothetical protein [Caudoviricetes sp.]